MTVTFDFQYYLLSICLMSAKIDEVSKTTYVFLVSETTQVFLKAHSHKYIIYAKFPYFLFQRQPKSFLSS